MKKELLELLEKKMPDAICSRCKGEGEYEVPIDYDMDSITAPVICGECEGSGIEMGYEDDVKELQKKCPWYLGTAINEGMKLSKP